MALPDFSLKRQLLAARRLRAVIAAKATRTFVESRGSFRPYGISWQPTGRDGSNCR